MKLSIVILNYNVQHFLQLCLSSVTEAVKGLDAEIIVIDNNSDDDSCKMVKENFPEIELIENSENVGFSKANNQAVATASGEYVCILNPDTVVPEDTFSKLLNFAEDKNKLGIVGCKLVDGRGQFLEESKRNLPVVKVAFQKQMGFSKSYYAHQLDENETGKVPILVGALMFMKQDIFNAVDGFDEDYFMYGEDIDLSYRVLKAGYENWYVSECTVLHFKGESTLKDKTYARRFYGAMKIFYRKHFDQNWFYGALVGLGVKLAKILPQTKKNDAISVKQYVLVSDQMYAALETKLDQPVKQARRLGSVENGTEIILDANYLSYKEITNHLCDVQLNGKATFKMIPKNAQFLIGSNHSTTRGEVIHF